MKPQALLLALTILSAGIPVALADEDPVRLPGQGEVKSVINNQTDTMPVRLAPGGGLLMSFDLDGDNIISQSEIEHGIVTAFADADTNEDGNLSPIEQADWADHLPTRDETLANPARFDPNLDRYVSLEEFAGAVQQIASIYADVGTGSISLISLEIEPARAERDRDDRHAPGGNAHKPGQHSSF